MWIPGVLRKTRRGPGRHGNTVLGQRLTPMGVALALALLVAAGCAGDGGGTVAPAPQQPAAAPAPAAPAPAPVAAPELAPAPEAAMEPQRGGTLKFGNAKEMTSPHPWVATSSVTQSIKEMMQETLVKYDEDFILRGLLAESWETNEDGSVWTFKLREGLKFHNGQEMTAEDVVWSVNYIKDPQNGARGYSVLSEDVAKAEAVDKYTVKFNLTGPIGLFGFRISQIGRLSIAPADSLKTGDVKLEGGVAPPGTGPFRFEDWVPADRTVVVRFDDYWRGPAFLDKIYFQLIAKRSGRQNALRAGDIQMAERLSPQFAQKIEKGEIKGITAEAARFSGYRRIIFNHESKLFSDRRMREAAALSIDKQVFLDEVFFGLGKAMGDDVPPGSDWERVLNANAPPRKVDLERAAQLLKEAGYNGEPVIFIAERGQGEPIGESLSRMLRKAGLNIDLKILESGVYEQKQKGADFDISPKGGSWRGDPLAAAGDLRCTTPETRFANDANYCNPEVDRLLDQYKQESDHQKHLEIYGKVVKLVFEDVHGFHIGWNYTRFFGWLNTVHDVELPGSTSYTTYEGGPWRIWMEQG